MSVQFTFIKPQYITSNALVYNGPPNGQSWKTIIETPPAYEVNFNERLMQLRQSFADSSTRVLLKGRYHGMTRSSADIEGYDKQTTAKRRGKFKYGWSFVDFNSNEFAWHLSTLGFSWELHDVNGVVVAKFVCEKKSHHLMGVLTVYEGSMPEPLLMLVLLSCTIVHNNVFNDNCCAVSTVVVV
ncbi:hypothetical protein LPJ57_001946 [Coemansia sp. RSA 486]|nr:hypothetical protein LPJ57_001946 [Coemansia sp. RSA 486]KAJ2225398.1 hypothetical protein IWW45_007894 [Coemansia sp. RSA 485]